MRGVRVCYHHGGRSLRGFTHPNYKHGFYCKPPSILLLLAFGAYRDELRRQQRGAIHDELASTMPLETPADYLRFMAAYRAAVASLPDVKLSPQLAAHIMRRRA